MRTRFRPRPRVILFAGFVTIAAVLAASDAWAADGTWGATADPGVQGPNMATLLQDGRVLVVGSDRTFHMVAEIYDPAPATWTRQADPIRQRYNFTATLLPDGRVLVVGGDALNGYKTSGTFDPATNSWAPSGDLNVHRWSGKVAALADGHVLMAGGSEVPKQLRDPDEHESADVLLVGFRAGRSVRRCGTLERHQPVARLRTRRRVSLGDQNRHGQTALQRREHRLRNGRPSMPVAFLTVSRRPLEDREMCLVAVFIDYCECRGRGSNPHAAFATQDFKPV